MNHAVGIQKKHDRILVNSNRREDKVSNESLYMDVLATSSIGKLQ
jgi:hypothetical protein